MKLDKTLNFKKVRCVKAYDDCLKIGKEYDVIDVSVEIKVKDDEGAFLYWESDHFEPVIESAENPIQNAELTPEFEAVEPKFKVGDKVYIPNIKNLCTIRNDEKVITSDGQYYCNLSDSHDLCFVLATTENHALLSKLYPHINFEAPPKPLTGSEPLMQRDRIIQAVNTLTDICHSASRNAGWWHDIKTGESLKRNKGEMLMLMVSELAEAMEADRKSLQDDHLPQYDGVSVEIADCLIRIFDFVGGFGLKTAEAMADKIEYNANRADHKIENRLKDNGKKY